MTVERLKIAICEAERFCERALVLLNSVTEPDQYDFWSSKESGACRRASMDLTRALAELRRSR